MTTVLKAGMYLLSLWLLLVLVIVNKINVDICISCPIAPKAELWSILGKNYLPITSIFLLTISAIFYFIFRRLINGSKDGPYEILEIEDKGSEHLVFLATYVIPLVGFGLETVRQSINLAITLVLLGAIYIRTNLFYANPTLSLLGFRLFNAKIKGGSAILISREDLAAGDAINVLLLDRRIFFANKAKAISE